MAFVVSRHPQWKYQGPSYLFHCNRTTTLGLTICTRHHPDQCKHPSTEPTRQNMTTVVLFQQRLFEAASQAPRRNITEAFEELYIKPTGYSVSGTETSHGKQLADAKETAALVNNRISPTAVTALNMAAPTTHAGASVLVTPLSKDEVCWNSIFILPSNVTCLIPLFSEYPFMLTRLSLTKSSGFWM